MRLITREDHQPERIVEMSVTQNKTGRVFDAIEFNELDVYKLRQLPAEALKDWFDTWACGFRYRGPK